MAKPKKILNAAADQAREPDEADEKLGRSEELCNRKDVREALLKKFKDIEKGFDDQAERSDDNMDWWDCYNCVLGDKQFYQGNAHIFVPIVKSAIEARKTRFVNQMFPQSGRFVEVISEDGTIPHAIAALLEHYIRRAKMRTQIAPALVKNGDIEGQMTVQVVWEETKRDVVWRSKAPVESEEDEDPIDDEEVETIEEETITEGGPTVYVIADSDLLVLPSTANSLKQALMDGGSVTTICRWSEAKVESKIASGEIDEKAGKTLLEEMRTDDKRSHNRRSKAKEMVDAAGIKGDTDGKYALVYRTWTYLTLDDKRRLHLAYYAGKDRILSCKRNPYWCDRIDLFSAPTDKVDGSFKGRSKLAFGVADLQYHANDACNEGADSAAYALMPIIMTDPEKNPKVGQMVLSLAAVWETSPDDTKFAQFPPLWKDALELVAADKNEIFQALSVNPAQITSAMGTQQKKKPTQAEIANEQQIDILTTADAVTVMEEEILTPVVTFMVELDHQYRDKALTVREYGETGMRMNMREIPPVQLDKRYAFRWYGVEAARNAQMMQQQIAGLNVIKSVPPALYPGYRLELGPMLSHMVENLLGPRLAPLTFIPASDEQSIAPEAENHLMDHGFQVPVHPMDQHLKHIQVHGQHAKLSKDPGGMIRAHIQQHLSALQQQQQQAAGQQQLQGPSGGQGQPGRGARPGAQPGQQRGGQNPPGTIHRDRLRDPAVMPRM